MSKWPAAALGAALVVSGVVACSGREHRGGRPRPRPEASTVATAPVPPAAGPLGGVRTWLYLVDADLAQATVGKIASSPYDMVVLDFVPSERDNADYPMARVVARLHGGTHPKVVLAYVDVGEAESYRTYWREGWRIGHPRWIVGGDPDGWEGNYPVAYWDPEWREIWLGPGGLLEGVVAAGFDGVYLDWVEAYSDDNVVAAAKRAGVDPRGEMIRWVGDMAAFLRARRPGAVVVGQNAAELAAGSAGYRRLLDGLAQQQVWFAGGAATAPPGDCPLPRTEADVDSPAYEESLPPPCRPLFEDEDSTLHMSSEAYLEDLKTVRGSGLPVFTVDYALDPAHVAWVHGTARALGFVPFVGSRALDRFESAQGAAEPAGG